MATTLDGTVGVTFPDATVVAPSEFVERFGEGCGLTQSGSDVLVDPKVRLKGEGFLDANGLYHTTRPVLPPEYITSGSHALSNGGDPTTTVSALAGDLVIAFCANGGGADWAAPTGWSTLWAGLFSNDHKYCANAAFYYFAAVDGDVTVNPNYTGTSNHSTSLIALVFRNVDQTTPFIQNTRSTYANTVVPAQQSLSGVLSSSAVIYMATGGHSAGGSARYNMTTSGYTEFDQGANDYYDHSQMVAYKVGPASSETVASPTFSASGSTGFSAIGGMIEVAGLV